MVGRDDHYDFGVSKGRNVKVGVGRDGAGVDIASVRTDDGDHRSFGTSRGGSPSGTEGVKVALVNELGQTHWVGGIELPRHRRFPQRQDGGLLGAL